MKSVIIDEIKAHKYRFLKTIVLYAVFVVLGLNAAAPGATLLDLQIAVNVTLEEIAYVLPSRSAGYAIGALINSFLTIFVDSQIALISSLSFSLVAIAVIPWNRTLIGMCATVFVNGIFTGIIDACGNVWLIHLWGKVNPPFMQALHFAFGLGGFIAPLIAEPFLLPIIERSEQNFNSSNFTVKRIQYTPSDLKIPYAYGIISTFAFVVVVLFLVVYGLKRDNKPHPSREKKENAKSVSLPRWLLLSVIIVSSFFLLIYCGLELCFGTLLPTFAVKSNLKLTKSTAAFLASMFWGTFTFFRCAVIFAVEAYGCQNLLLFNLFLVILSNFFLLPFGNNYEWALWTGVAIMGCGLSSIFGAMLGFLEEFVTVTNQMASIFCVCVCIGEFIVPVIVGKYADTNPEVFLYVCLLCSVLCCISFSVLLLLKYKCLNYKKPPENINTITISTNTVAF